MKSLLIDTEFTRIEISLKIRFTLFGDLVVTSFNTDNESIVHQNCEPATHMTTRFVDVFRNYLWREDETRLKNFENSLIGWQLHPFARLSHCSGLPEQILTTIDVSEPVDLSGIDLQPISDQVYYDGLKSGGITGDSRGPDCLLGPVQKLSGPVYGHRVRGGSRKHSTEAMYDDDSRGLEGPERPVVSPETDLQIFADGGTTWADLTGFQRDVLAAIRRLERTDEISFGQSIKRELETHHEEVLHGRLYQNLDDLVDTGLVKKGTVDGRTNRYTLTPQARIMLEDHARRLADVCDLSTVATDGGNPETLAVDGDRNE